ncbi:MAG TPA: SPFH domain-containing protein [Burkholderiaceae bacterium]|nr:SPFH domain-containing protein [Burkholderiaceae bacterium]
MNQRLTRLAASIRGAFSSTFQRGAPALRDATTRTGRALINSRSVIITTLIAAVGAYALVTHPPLKTVPRGEVGVRTNHLTGGVAEFRDGGVLVWPALHELRSYPLRDQVYQPTQGRRADGDAPFQSIEGLSLGVDLSVRYALDSTRIAQIAKNLPDDIGGQVVQPAVQGVIYKVFTRYTVREIFSSKRAEIQQSIETELRGKLAADGIVLRSVQIGKVDLPADYRRGMDRLLAEELESEKMRYTLELKEKQVAETELVAKADKVRRETAASAAASEQVIAARAQEEAMKHVLPFKQKQIEQRQLEAEAEKGARIRSAEGSAQARRIEAQGEADSRQKLADAEAYRMERIGKIASEQMARDGALLSRHPLLIQKTVADKLSDKIQVIIAPPGTNGQFIAAGLVGGANATATSAAADAKEGE